MSHQINQREYMTRRGALQRLGGLAAYAAVPAGVLGLSGCAADISSKRSYIHGVVSRAKHSPVTRWSDVMLQTVRDRSIAPPPATRAFAMGHMAGFLAANGLRPEYRSAYQVGEGPRDGDADIAYGVALARAASHGLGASLGADVARFLAEYPDSDRKSRSVEWGNRVGQMIVNTRGRDGASTAAYDQDYQRYPKRSDMLTWHPTRNRFGAADAPVFKPIEKPLLPGWGEITPWAISSASAFAPQDFVDVESPEFARQFLKVKALGGINSTKRTADQTQVAFFWEDGPKGVTPPGHWQIIAMDLMQRLDLDLLGQAHFMAMLSLAQADAGIVTWDCKYKQDIVRPETAVGVLADKLGNDALIGQGERNWVTLIPTPPFPAYVSGHSMFSASSAQMLKHLIGRDRISFSGKAPDLVNWPTQLRGVSRSWSSLSQAAQEGGDSREYGGIHWEADNVEGLRVGRKIADAVFRGGVIARA